MADIIKALNESTNSAGGFTVPEEYATRMLELIQENTIVVPDLDHVQMNSDTFKIPKVTAGNTAYIVSELGTITKSDQAFGQITLSPVKFAARMDLSTELLEDNNVGLAEAVSKQMAKDIALKIEDEVFNGTGSGFEGLRYTGSFTNKVTAGDNATNGGTIKVTDFSNAIDEVMADNHDSPDVTYLHSKVLGDVRNLTDSSARPLFNAETFGSPLLKEGVIGTIYGMAVKVANKLPINLSYGTGSAATASDAIVGIRGMFGYYSTRREIQFNQDYDIDTDTRQIQMNTRTAFAIKYPDAYCVIRAIHV